jgi:hypothetical protein
MLGKSLFAELVEPAGGDVFFKLSVPRRPILLEKPIAKPRKLFRLQLLDLLLKLFYACHFSPERSTRRCSSAAQRFKLSGFGPLDALAR